MQNEVTVDWPAITKSRQISSRLLEQLILSIVADPNPGHGLTPEQRNICDAIVAYSGVPNHYLTAAIGQEVVYRQLLKLKSTARYFETWGGASAQVALDACAEIEKSLDRMNSRDTYREVTGFLAYGQDSTEPTWARYERARSIREMMRNGQTRADAEAFYDEMMKTANGGDK